MSWCRSLTVYVLKRKDPGTYVAHNRVDGFSDGTATTLCNPSRESYAETHWHEEGLPGIRRDQISVTLRVKYCEKCREIEERKREVAKMVLYVVLNENNEFYRRLSGATAGTILSSNAREPLEQYLDGLLHKEAKLLRIVEFRMVEEFSMAPVKS